MSLRLHWPTALILVLAAIPRLHFAWTDAGTYWPDENFQTIEQAHRVAFGYGFIPWEFRLGARSWLFPGFLGLYWKFLDLIGFHESQQLVPLAKSLMVVFFVSGLWASMRIAEKLEGKSAARLAGMIGATFPASLVYSSRVMTEMASVPFILFAALLMLERGRGRNLTAGVLASLSIFLRYQNGLVAVWLLLMLLVARRWADARWYTLGATAMGLAGGALDWITWGAPFKSFWVYVKFNLIEGKAADFGTAPFNYYADHMWLSVGFPLAVLILGFLVAAWRHWGFALIGVFYVLLHSFVPHKELRFIMPIVPLMLTLSAIGLARIWSKANATGWPLTALGLSLSLMLTCQAVTATFGDMGQWLKTPSAKHSPWHNSEDINRLLWAANTRDDLCGIVLGGVAAAWQGGYAYLHRDVPIFIDFNYGEEKGANYAIMPADAKRDPYKPVAYFKGWALFRRDGTCQPWPSFNHEIL